MSKSKILGFFMFLLVFTSLVMSFIITPSSPTTTDILTSDWTGTADDESLKWFKGVEEQIALENSTTVPSSNTNKGEVWYFEVNYTNGTLIGTSDSVTILNSAPVITEIADREIQEDVEWNTLKIEDFASDADEDKDTLSYSFGDGSTTLSNGMTIDSLTGLISWTPSNAGSETVTVQVTDNFAVDNETFKILVGPDLCKGVEVGDIRIKDYDIEDEDDDFYPGDIVTVEVEIDNDYSSSDDDSDVSDIIVEVILYDLDDGDELDSVESDEFDLDAGDEEDDLDEFELEIPSDVDADNEIRVYVLVYEDGDKDCNCRFESKEIDVKRKKHDVDVDKFTLSPSVANPGDTVSVRIEVENIGARDEDDVYVKLLNSALGVSLTSNEFDLDDYGKSDSDHRITFTFTIPDDANAGTYQIEANVYDEDGDIYDSGSEFKDLVVSSTGVTPITTPTGTSVTSLAILNFDAEVEEERSVSVPVKITNDGISTVQYTISVTNIDDWAEPVSDKIVTVAAGQSVTEYMYLKSKEDVTGKHSATINVKSGNEIVATQTAIVEVVGEAEGEGVVSKVSGWFGDNTILLWILGDIVLILLAVWFIKMLFTSKKH